MKHKLHTLYAVLLLALLHQQVNAQRDTLPRQEIRKNRVGLELLGDPLSLYYDRLLVQKGAYSFYAGAGFGVPLAFAGFPSLSVGFGNSYRLTRKLSVFVNQRSQILSLSFPQIPFKQVHGYVPGRNHFGFNALSFNVAAGPSFHCGNWEFSPLYPSCIYALGIFSDEDAYYAWFGAIALNTRIYYHF